LCWAIQPSKSIRKRCKHISLSKPYTRFSSWRPPLSLSTFPIWLRAPAIPGLGPRRSTAHPPSSGNPTPKLQLHRSSARALGRSSSQHGSAALPLSHAATPRRPGRQDPVRLRAAAVTTASRPDSSVHSTGLASNPPVRPTVQWHSIGQAPRTKVSHSASSPRSLVTSANFSLEFCPHMYRLSVLVLFIYISYVKLNMCVLL
jgi:hypothetical protein